MGFCIDCKHSRLLYGGPRLCRAPLVRELDPVGGWVECSTARQDATRIGPSPCGLKGRLFETRPPEPPRRPSWWARAWRQFGRYVWATEHNLGLDVRPPR